MKTKPYVLLFVVLMMAACQPKTEIESVDPDAAEDDVTVVLDNYIEAFSALNFDDILVLLDSAGLYCGTDPAELWDKAGLANVWEEWTETMAGESFEMNYSLIDRKIRVAPDGKSALVLEQFTMTTFGEKLPVRAIFHLINIDENWMIDFISWSLVPYNEDVSKLKKALE